MHFKNVLKLFTCLLICTNAQRLNAQQIDTLKLDSFFHALDKHNLAMGTITISSNGKIYYSRSVGGRYINGDTILKANDQTKYRIGSISKMFTAVMVFQLIEEKRLKLNDLLGKFFPQLPNGNSITIRHLLYHRSGLADYAQPAERYEQWMDSVRTREQLLTIISTSKPDFQPDAEAKYSNSNYLILSYIIEKLDKSSYSESLQKRIIGKINLHETNYAAPINPNLNEAVSYSFNGKWVGQKQTDTSIHQGAGMIASTPGDLTRFIESVFKFKLLKESSVRVMTTWMDDYGMGVFPYNKMNPDFTGIGHDGHIEGFSSSLQYYPYQKLTIAYCTNGEIYPKKDILSFVVGVCEKKPQVVPLFERVILADTMLNSYVGRYFNQERGIDVLVEKFGQTVQLTVKGNKFEIEPIGANEFVFRPLGFFFTFETAKDQLLIRERDQRYYLKKQ